MSLYYISDGKSAEQGWKQINGKRYYFGQRDSSNMYQAKTNTICTINDKRYLFNEDGTLASEGWNLFDENWYYVLTSGELATEDMWIDGSFYHFDEYGQMMEDSQIKKGIVIENGICKLYSEDGVLLETGSGEGWSLLGGNYYYLRDGGLLKSGSYKLPDGNWYYFDENGIMQLNVKVKNRWYGES